VFLNTNLLELDKLGASGLQIEAAAGLVGDTLLAGAHDERHEGRGLDLEEEEEHRADGCVGCKKDVLESICVDTFSLCNRRYDHFLKGSIIPPGVSVMSQSKRF